jgi:hypothetical protein
MLRVFNKWVVIPAAEYDSYSDRFEQVYKDLFQTNQKLAHERLMHDTCASENGVLRDQLLELKDKYAKVLCLCVGLTEKDVLKMAEDSADGG